MPLATWASRCAPSVSAITRRAQQPRCPSNRAAPCVDLFRAPFDRTDNVSLTRSDRMPTDNMLAIASRAEFLVWAAKMSCQADKSQDFFRGNDSLVKKRSLLFDFGIKRLKPARSNPFRRIARAPNTVSATGCKLNAAQRLSVRQRPRHSNRGG